MNFRTKKAKVGMSGSFNKQHDIAIYRAPSYAKYSVLPAEYFTTVRLKVYFTVQNTGGAGPLNTAFDSGGRWINNQLTLNNCFQPLTAWQGIALVPMSQLSWNWQTNPQAQYNGFQELCNATTYLKYQPISSVVRLKPYSADVADNLIACMMPLQTGSGASAPLDLASAVLKPNAVSKDFITGAKLSPLKMYIDYAKYLGVDRYTYRNDISGLYTADYVTSGGLVGTPTKGVGLSITLQTTDRTMPSQANTGFLLEIDTYVRFFQYAYNLQL